MNLHKFRKYKKMGKRIVLNEKAYHITFARNLGSIKMNGLVPMGGKNKNFEWCEDAVHLSSTKYGGLECMAMLYEDSKENGVDIKTGGLVLLEVDMGQLDTSKLTTGEAFEEWDNPSARVQEWLYYGKIHPNNLKVVQIKTKFRDDNMNRIYKLGKYASK